MDTRECLACGHQNKPGAMSCAACSTSLNLKLCTACEAANALIAENCYECGAPLMQRGPVNEVPTPVAAAERLFEDAPRIRLLPLQQHSRLPAAGARLASVWIVLVALAGGGGYYLASRVELPVAALAPTAAAPQPAAKAATSGPVTHTGTAPTAAATATAAAPSYVRITHTQPGEAVEQPVAPAAEKPINNPPAGCAPSVAALGLCPVK